VLAILGVCFCLRRNGGHKCFEIPSNFLQGIIVRIFLQGIINRIEEGYHTANERSTVEELATRNNQIQPNHPSPSPSPYILLESGGDFSIVEKYVPSIQSTNAKEAKHPKLNEMSVSTGGSKVLEPGSSLCLISLDPENSSVSENQGCKKLAAAHDGCDIDSGGVSDKVPGVLPYYNIIDESKRRSDNKVEDNVFITSNVEIPDEE